MYKVVSLDIPCGAEVGSLLLYIAILVVYLEQSLPPRSSLSFV